MCKLKKNKTKTQQKPHNTLIPPTPHPNLLGHKIEEDKERQLLSIKNQSATSIVKQLY